MNGRFTFITGLRGIAALSVMLFHAARGNHLDILSADFVQLVVSAEAGVVIFFVISGFVIARSLERKHLDLKSVWSFLVRRAIRLDPPYWASIALVIAFSLLASQLFPDRRAVEYTTGQLNAHVFYLQEILGYVHVNPVYWTLCYEVQFYAIFALLLVWRSTFLMGIVFLVSLLWPLVILPELPGLFVNLFYTFLLGVGAYHAWVTPRIRPWFFAYVGIVLVNSVIQSQPYGLISALTALVLLAAAMSDNIYKGLNWRWLQFLGVVSYSLYLTHNPITGATFRVWYLIADRSPPSQLIGLALAAVASLICAWLFYKFIEAPCSKLAVVPSLNWFDHARP